MLAMLVMACAQALGYRIIAEQPYPAGIADLRINLEKQL